MRKKPIDDVKKIGIASIKFDKNGEIRDIYFKPTMEIKLDGVDLEKIKQEYETVDENIVKNATDLVMASWFNTVNKIELMDHDECQIKSTIISCKPDNKGVKNCRIEYFIESNKIVNTKVN